VTSSQKANTMSSTVSSLLLSPALFFFCSAAIAQQSNKPVTPVPQHLEGLSAVAKDSKSGTPQSSPEIQSLIKALAGKWSVSVKFESNPAMPGGAEGTGEETWRAGPGGFTFLDEVHLPTPGGEVFLLGIIWWDAKTKSLRGMECNNQLPYTCDLKGALNDITMKWDGKEFTIDELETSPDGKKMMWHEVWSEITPTSFTQTGDMGEPSGPFKRFLTIHGTRLAASKESSAEKPEQAPTGEVQTRHINVSFAPGERP